MIAVSELQTAISHRAINVYLLGLKRVIAFTSVRNPDQNALSLLDAWLRKGESERDRFTSIAKPTSDELAKWIAGHKSVRDEMPTLLAAASSAHMVKVVEESVKEPLPFDPAEVPKWIFRTMVMLFELYFLSLATLAHAVSSRYGDDMRSAADIYTDKHPLVVHFSDLVAMAAECVDCAEAALTFVRSWP